MACKRYVAWTKIGSWSCLACGECCRGFKVVLTPYEYARLSMIYGYGIAPMDSLGNPCIGQVDGHCIFQDSRSLCILQPIGLKPIACRIWPFTVRREPIPECEDALFRYKGNECYIYVDRSYPCPGVGRGKSELLSLTLAELIEIRYNLSKRQWYSTSTHLLSQMMRSQTR